MEIVQRSVDNINQVCKEVGYQNYSITVVTEVNEAFEGAQTLPVPKSYSTIKGAKYKARALQYAIEQREKNQENTSKTKLLTFSSQCRYSQSICQLSEKRYNKLQRRQKNRYRAIPIIQTQDKHTQPLHLPD